MGKWVVAFAAALMVVVGAAPVAAQEASPAASPASIIGEPDPEDCTIAPRSYEDLQAVLATPTAAAPAATPAAPVLPEGDAVAPQTQADVLATIHQGVACINANNLMSLLAVYSDSLVNRLLGGQTITKDQYDQILAAQPLPADQRTEIVGVQGMVKMADGRVAVLIVGDDHSNPRPASTTLFIMAQNNGTWQIDDFIKTPESATPTP